MDDEIIDTVMARDLHADASRTSSLFGWLVMHDPLGYPGKTIARFVTNVLSPYVLVADTLAEIHAVLPPSLCNQEVRRHDRRAY